MKINKNIFFWLFAFILLLALLFYFNNRAVKSTIKIGILHSLNGTMAISEKSLVDMLLLGIEEINKNGGLLGQQIEAIVADTHSQSDLAAQEAARLLKEEKVAAIFGCWTSSCRKAVEPIIEEHNSILFYALQYEGLENSNHIIYTGAVPNQQIIPGVSWAMSTFGSRVYLLGSDYVFPRLANQIIRDVVTIKNGEILSEQYSALGAHDFDRIVKEIGRRRPDVILNTLNGDSNRSFFKKLHQQGLGKIPVISFSIAEAELLSIPEARTNTHYTVWSYFQSIKSRENRAFVTWVQQRLGKSQVVGDPMEASYVGLSLWAQTVRRVESTDADIIRDSIKNQAVKMPEGVVSVDSSNHHILKTVRIGRARQDGQFDIVWRSSRPIRPVPFPTFHTRQKWGDIIESTYRSGR